MSTHSSSKGVPLPLASRLSIAGVILQIHIKMARGRVSIAICTVYRVSIHSKLSNPDHCLVINRDLRYKKWSSKKLLNKITRDKLRFVVYLSILGRCSFKKEWQIFSSGDEDGSSERNKRRRRVTIVTNAGGIQNSYREHAGLPDGKSLQTSLKFMF